MAVSSTILFNTYRGHIHNIDFTRKNLENQYLSGNVCRRDVEQVYKGIFLEAFSNLEYLVEDLFIGFLSIRVSHSRLMQYPTFIFPSPQSARKIVLGDRRYINWLNVDILSKISGIYFKGRDPFLAVQNQKQMIQEIAIIRNALAHSSRTSKTKFANLLKRNYQLLANHEKRPVSFLRSIYALNPRQTRYEYYTLEMIDIARGLCI